MDVDLIIRQGRVFDGTPGPSREADVLIEGGRVLKIEANSPARGRQEIAASGHWVMPGAIDIHTHYDAEVEVAPGLLESLQHGVTSLIFGNCSLSLALGNAEDMIDLFARVENLPRATLAKWLDGKVDWRTPGQYYEHLERLALGPNIATLMGHSNLRLAVLGKTRSLKPTRLDWGEKNALRSLAHEAMEAGYLGLSIDMLQWHRWKGFKYNGASAPSHYARMSEFRLLADVLRQHDRVLQATPDAGRRYLVPLLALLSHGLGRKPLRMSMLTSLDFTNNRRLGPMTRRLASVINDGLRGNLRFQSLSVPFELWSDGCNTPVFEEMQASACLMNADSAAQRQLLYRDSDWRRQLRREWLSRFGASFHKDLARMQIVGCPDAALIGQSFADVALRRGQAAVDTFIDLISEYDEHIRWHSVIANDRPAEMRRYLQHPYIQLGFSDAGAHNRNLAFQNSHLWFLRDCLLHSDALPIEKAVWRITGELADWFGLDAGYLQEGRVADVLVLDPHALKTDLSGPQETTDPRFDGAMRMVTRSGRAVQQVIVGGQRVLDQGRPHPEFEQRRFGRLLRSTHRGVE
jgi:N-acyl-D-aspartate/D-glutamate deacylase